ncbi:MAG: hypothetical protein M3O86_02020, partial [Actinomycetota bacterium]|nr:hypothetical protein [Actinomycetota bacterium]
AEGLAFFRVIAPLVAAADPAAAETVTEVLSLDNPPAEDGGERVATALESVYDKLGITAEQVGTFEPTPE